MVEVFGNLWTYPAGIKIITTNGSIKTNGHVVMGRGCAYEATKLHRGVPALLGRLIQAHGNHVHIIFRNVPYVLVSFPVKHVWHERADVELIKRSAEELVTLANDQQGIDDYSKVVLPRPGCGNGGLRWEDVKSVIAPILDDRFHVITFGGSK